MVVLIVGVCSCRRELEHEIADDSAFERVSVELDQEALYRQQTNPSQILYSLIQYNDREKVYVLELTAEDMQKLGITPEAYRDAQASVRQLNEARIERQ